MSTSKTQNLIFLHLPKNGGTTIHSILDRHYKPENTHNIKVVNNSRLSTQEFIELPESERKKIKLLKGHMLFGLHNYLYGESKYITFLRKPENRVVSLYYYLKNKPNYKIRNEIPINNLTLDDFVRNINIPELHNAQIRLISGLEHGTEEEMLEQALINIKNHFSFVGLQEHFNTSVIILSDLYKWGIPYYKSLNKGKYKETKIDPDTLQLINEYNKGDNLLYQEVEKRFNKQRETTFCLDYKEYQLKLANRIHASYKLKQIKKLF